MDADNPFRRRPSLDAVLTLPPKRRPSTAPGGRSCALPRLPSLRGVAQKQCETGSSPASTCSTARPASVPADAADFPTLELQSPLHQDRSGSDASARAHDARVESRATSKDSTPEPLELAPKQISRESNRSAPSRSKQRRPTKTTGAAAEQELERNQALALEALIGAILSGRGVSREVALDSAPNRFERSNNRAVTQPAIARVEEEKKTTVRSVSKQSNNPDVPVRSVSKQSNQDVPVRSSSRSGPTPPTEGAPTRRSRKAGTFAASALLAVPTRLNSKDSSATTNSDVSSVSARSTNSAGARGQDEGEDVKQKEACPRKVAEITFQLVKSLLHPDNTKVFPQDFDVIHEEVKEVLQSRAAGELQSLVVAAPGKASMGDPENPSDHNATVALVMMVLRVMGPRHQIHFVDLVPQALYWHRRSMVLMEPALKKAVDNTAWVGRKWSPKKKHEDSVVEQVEKIFMDMTAAAGGLMTSRQWHRIHVAIKEQQATGLKNFEAHTIFYVGTHKNGEATHGMTFRRFRSALMDLAMEMQVHPQSVFLAIAKNMGLQ